MKKLKKIRRCLLVAILISLICLPMSIFAADNVTFSFNGSSNVNTNTEFVVDFVINNPKELNGSSGSLSIDNPSCISIKTVSPAGDNIVVNNNTFVYTSLLGLNETKTILKVTLKSGLSNCTTNLRMSNIKAAFFDSEKNLSKISTTKAITVGESTQSSDATLKSLRPSTGSLSPAFSPSVTKYEMSVGSGTNTVTFTGVPSDSGARIVSGSTCNLASSSTTCKIVVKAEDGKTKEYSVVVKKDDGNTNTDTPAPNLSDDATLKSLNVSGYTLTPRFNKNTTVYSMNVGSNITGLKVTAVPTDSNAKVTVTGNSNWKEGVNTIKITVTAPSGAEKIYTVNVTKKGTGNTTTTTKSSDNFLKSLSVSNGEISPKFDKNNNSYSLEVSSDVNKLDLSAIASDSKSKVNITGNENLKIGNNIINIEVQAEDGSIRIYTLNVNKSDKSSNNKLSDIIVKDYPIDFEKDKYEYDITVPSDVDELKIDVTKENKNSKVEITGNKNLKEGNNTVLIKVTDENGFTQYYKLNVQKEADDGKFLGLSLSNWLLLLGLLLLTLMFVLILFLIFRKKKDDETPVAAPTNNPNPTPIIEFKPEFNFGSKNGTDDDIVEEGGVLNQYTGLPPKKDEKEVKEIDYEEAKLEEIPYDPYDDQVTKDELFDALHESIEKKDVRKLKMLYEQEKLNREKEEIRKSYEDDE